MFEIVIDVVCGDVIDPMLIVLLGIGVDANTGPVPLHATLKLIVACVASLVVNVSVSMCMPYGDPTGGLHTIVMLCVDGLTRLLIGMLDVIANQLDANVVDTFNMPYALLVTTIVDGCDVDPCTTDPKSIVLPGIGADANVGPVAVHVIV